MIIASGACLVAVAVWLGQSIRNGSSQVDYTPASGPRDVQHRQVPLDAGQTADQAAPDRPGFAGRPETPTLAATATPDTTNAVRTNPVPGRAASTPWGVGVTPNMGLPSDVPSIIVVNRAEPDVVVTVGWPGGLTSKVEPRQSVMVIGGNGCDEWPDHMIGCTVTVDTSKAKNDFGELDVFTLLQEGRDGRQVSRTVQMPLHKSVQIWYIISGYAPNAVSWVAPCEVPRPD
jgi:hypothetical protein